MSLRKRVQVLLAFLVGIPLLLLLFETYRASRTALLDQMKQEALHIAQLQSAEVDLVFDPPRMVAESLARAVESIPTMNADAIQRLLARTVTQTPPIYGTTVAFVPGATPLGRFAPYAYRRNGQVIVKSLAEPSYDYLRRDWFSVPVSRGRGLWTKPYFDEGGGETLMVTYAEPIRREGRVIGVATVDLSLDSLVASLHGLKPGGSGTVYLVNKHRQILAHPALKAVSEAQASPPSMRSRPSSPGKAWTPWR